MSTDNIRPGSLFLTYDSFRHLLHASRAGEGTDGFLHYMHEELSFILREGHNPNVWMTYYQFPDRRDIPPIRDMQNTAYLDLVAQAAERCGGRCRYTINAGDAIYCINNDIVPLTPAAQRTALAQRSDYPNPAEGYGENMPRTNIVLPEYRSYMALQTEKGAVLFTNTAEGERQRKAYEKYHELNFFNPSQPTGKLTYWEIIADPRAVNGKVDCLHPSAQGQEKGFENAYVDATLLSQGHTIREYDLNQNTENYNIFCQRRDPDQVTPKRLSDMTLREIWNKAITSNRSREKGMVCVENRAFPGEERETTLKLKR